MGLLDQLINGGPVLLVLTGISVFSVTLVILKFIDLRRMRPQKTYSAASIAEQIEREGLAPVLAELKKDPSPLAQMSAAALDFFSENATGHCCKGPDNPLCVEDIRRELELVAAEQVQRLEYATPALSVAAHLSPLLGLLGTVLGMITAFKGLESSGMQADPALLAGGIWEALLTTAFGMSIAIPLLAILRFLEVQVDQTVHKMERIGVGLLRELGNGLLDNPSVDEQREALRGLQ